LSGSASASDGSASPGDWAVRQPDKNSKRGIGFNASCNISAVASTRSPISLSVKKIGSPFFACPACPVM
jgi:hypothetical protein